MKISNFFDHKKILVTGGSGFIGGAFLEALLLNSGANLHNIDKLSYASNNKRIDLLLKNNQFLYNRYEFTQLDLINNELLKKAINKIKPDLIINFAAESHVDRSIENPINFINSNILGTFNLLNNSLNYWKSIKNRLKKDNFRFLHISTDEVYGTVENNKKFNEESPYSPRSPYSASKASSDHLVNAWHHTYAFPSLITNCSNNYGPWQFPEKLIPLSIIKALNNEPIPLYGDGKNIRDWLHVDDHINGILSVLEKGEIGDSYCIGGYGEMTNLAIVKKICSIFDTINPINSPHEQLIKFVKDRPGHDRRYAINSTKITVNLGWIPKFNFDQGLESTIKWYIENYVLMEELFKQSLKIK